NVIPPRHQFPTAAASQGAAADETKNGMIKIVAVEVIDSHGRRSGTDETINDKVVEKPVDAHIAVAEEAFADQPARVGEAALEMFAVTFRQQQQPHMLKHESR